MASRLPPPRPCGWQPKAGSLCGHVGTCTRRRVCICARGPTGVGGASWGSRTCVQSTVAFGPTSSHKAPPPPVGAHPGSKAVCVRIGGTGEGSCQPAEDSRAGDALRRSRAVLPASHGRKPPRRALPGFRVKFSLLLFKDFMYLRERTRGWKGAEAGAGSLLSREPDAGSIPGPQGHDLSRRNPPGAPSG